MEEEIWKPIQDCYDYEISNLGRVKNIKTGKYLKSCIRPDGYVNISLCVNNKTKNCKVHRLIAQAFIPNPENKPTVNHIDRNRSNNSISNLEWATISEQNYHSAKIMSPNRPYLCKKIIQKDLNDNYIQTFNSIKEASKWLINLKKTHLTNINTISEKIRLAIKQKLYLYDYVWEYLTHKELLINEIWKEIPYKIIDKQGYQVSDQGRFKNNKNEIKEVYMSKSGYIRLRIGNKKYLLHRLIALTFLDNPLNKEHINHIDGDKLNNNLEWSTCKENNIHKIQIGLSNCTKKVIQYDKNMNYVNKFNSIKECANANNISASCVSFNCLGLSKNPKISYYFRYAE